MNTRAPHVSAEAAYKVETMEPQQGVTPDEVQRLSAEIDHISQTISELMEQREAMIERRFQLMEELGGISLDKSAGRDVPRTIVARQ